MLKNSFSRELQKSFRIRMSYKRFSLVGYTFQVTDFDSTFTAERLFQHPPLFTTIDETSHRKGEVPILTVRIKTKRRPWWLYVVIAFSCVPIGAFWAYVAYSYLGFNAALAQQVFIVFGALPLVFSPLLYFANEKQVRDHRSKALPLASNAFVALFAAAVVYFIGKHEGDTVFAVVYGIVVIGLGLFISMFVINYEFE